LDICCYRGKARQFCSCIDKVLEKMLLGSWLLISVGPLAKIESGKLGEEVVDQHLCYGVPLYQFERDQMLRYHHGVLVWKGSQPV